MPILSPRFSAAFDLAARWHATQLRKSTVIPYISHLMSVSALVLEHGGDEDQAIAALLHDAVEDADSAEEANARRAKIDREFGPRVAAMVEGCTDGTPDVQVEKPDWHTRKRAYIAHLAHAAPETLLVSCVDKLHNARAILGNFRNIEHAVFERFNASRKDTLWYYEQLAQAFTGALSGALSAELERTVATLLIEAGDAEA